MKRAGIKRRRRVGSIAGLLSMLLLVGVMASPSSAQWVQLPTFHQFSVNTSVMVPDSGGSMLGGFGYREAVRAGRRPFGRIDRLSTGHTGVSVSAQIIDLDAMDAALLQEARQRRAFRAANDVHVATPRLDNELDTGRKRSGVATRRRAAWIRRNLYRPR